MPKPPSNSKLATPFCALLPAIMAVCSCITPCSADDAPLQDVCPAAPRSETAPLFANGLPCKNPAAVTAGDFKTSLLNHAGDTDNFQRSAIRAATVAEFPGLNAQGLSLARADLAVDGVLLPHSHPRASEMMFVSHGTIVAGFVDTGDRVFQRTLRAGDVFVFPRGLLHFCANAGFGLATAFSVFNSQNPGVMGIAGAGFAADSDALAERLVSRILSLRSNSCAAMADLYT